MKETILRQWHLLKELPRSPQKITALDLTQRIGREGFPVDKRTIERDLQQLSRIFPIIVDDRSKPYGWSWSKDTRGVTIPGLTLTQALAFSMIKRFLSSLLPGSLLDELNPSFQDAEARLSELPKERGKPSWTDKIRMVPPTQPLIPAHNAADIQHTVYEALLQGQQVRVMYDKRGADAPAEFTVHPLGLVQRGPVMYLVCTLFHYQDVLLLALHRILSAVVLEAQVVYPPGFTLDDYVDSGALHFGQGRKVRLSARFKAEAAEHLYETPLAIDHKLEPEEGGWVRVSATVQDTPQLVWWLLGFGDQVEVLAPAALRKAIAGNVAGLYRLYRSSRRARDGKSQRARG